MLKTLFSMGYGLDLFQRRRQAVVQAKHKEGNCRLFAEEIQVAEKGKVRSKNLQSVSSLFLKRYRAAEKALSSGCFRASCQADELFLQKEKIIGLA
jgi:hypothetical protein